MEKVITAKWARRTLTLLLTFIIAGAFIPLSGGQAYAASKTHLITTLNAKIVQANPIVGRFDTSYKIMVGDKIKNDTDSLQFVFIDSKEYHETGDGLYSDDIDIEPNETVTITKEYAANNEGSNANIITTDYWYLYGEFLFYEKNNSLTKSAFDTVKTKGQEIQANGWNACLFSPVSSENADKAFTANIDKSKLSGGTATLSKTSKIYVTDTVNLTITPNSGTKFAKTPAVSLKNSNATLGNLTKTQSGAYTCTISGFTGNEMVIVRASVVDGTDKSPQTGDAMSLYGLLTIFIAAGATCGVIYRRKVRQ